jgi:hypothetical protein
MIPNHTGGINVSPKKSESQNAINYKSKIKFLKRELS